ncbi:hypothetical protein HU200_018958 [Digitaria exilis]|uniref:Uncharacterized protein n=1 Tax=Digitaria exilis TaxID=1010633 RepID=A0A835F3M0_9POAL|nr:hypothetical protein HU200_018958 [Digitaria exilis]
MAARIYTWHTTPFLGCGDNDLTDEQLRSGFTCGKSLNRLRHRGIHFRPWFCVIGPAAWERATISKIHIRTAMRKMVMARALEI